MTNPDINILREDINNVYISWNYFYFSPPTTVNYRTGNYELPNTSIKMCFNSLTHYPSMTKLDKIKRSSLDSELGIRSDHFKHIYVDLKRNKNTFLDLKEIANSIPNIGFKIDKKDRETTPRFIIPINKHNNIYNVVVIYANNDKIPRILSKTNHNVITFMSRIDNRKNKINIFNDIHEQFCLDQTNKIYLAYLTLDYATLFYLCTKYIPCLDLIIKKNNTDIEFKTGITKTFRNH